MQEAIPAMLPLQASSKWFYVLLMVGSIFLVSAGLTMRFWSGSIEFVEDAPVLPSVLFVIPLASKHFHFAKDYIVPPFVNNTATIECHVVFVFTNSTELQNFGVVTFTNKDNLYISKFPNIFALTYTDSTKGIVTMKKWYGITEMRKHRRYDYYITNDSEIKFVKTIDFEFYQRLENISIAVGDVPGHFGYGNDFFGTQKRFLLRYMTNKTEQVEKFYNNPVPYVWFSNVPFYRESTLDDFFFDIQFQPTPEYAAIVTWEIFDHLIYLYWLAITTDFKLVRPTEFGVHVGWSMENLLDPAKMDQILPHYQPLMIENRLYEAYVTRNASDPSLSHFWIAYHVDRV